MREPFVVLIVGSACLFGNPPGGQLPEASRWMLPVRFEENRGQAAPGVRFLARGEGFELLARDRELEMRAAPGGRPIRIKLEGAPAGGLHGEEPLQGRSAYFRGAEPSQWITGVANYRKIRYRSVYAGIDLLVYGSQGKLEYDWVVAPGADPAEIRFSLSGVSHTGIDSNGDLVLGGPGFEVRHKKPLVYQEMGGKRREIAGGFRRLGRNQIGFQVGKYDPALALVIDPYLVYATQFGGNPFQGYTAGAVGGGGGRGLAIAVDRAGSAYVGGRVSGPGSLPATGKPFQSEYGGGYDGFVCKFTPDGSDVVYATYLSGGGFEEVRGIAVDREGNAYVTGTSENRFPQAGPFQPRPGAPGIFVAKINAAGSALVWSFSLGGGFKSQWWYGGFDPGDSAGNAIALDAANNVYVAGVTIGPLPTTPGSFQTEQPVATSCLQASHCTDAFVAKIDSSGTRLVYLTYLGGAEWDVIQGLAVDGAGNAYVTGFTRSADFPTTAGTIQTGPAKGADYDRSATGREDGFVAKIDPSGAKLVYSTYLGGTSEDRLTGIAVDTDGYAYVTGYTGSADYPGRNRNDGLSWWMMPFLVQKLNPNGSGLAYSYFAPEGWSGVPVGGIALDSGRRAHVTGYAVFFAPMVNPLQDNEWQGRYCPGTGCKPSDLTAGTNQFVLTLNAEGTDAVFGSELAYGGFAAGNAIAVDREDNVYTTGVSQKLIPLRKPSVTPGTAFVAKISFAADAPRLPRAGVVNAASFRPGRSRCALGTIFGQNLTASEGDFLPSGPPLSNRLGGLTMTLDGVFPVPILGVFAHGATQQVNFQWPCEGGDSLVITRDSDGISGYNKSFPGLIAPEIFMVGDGYGAIQHAADYSLVTPSNPAVPGEILVSYTNIPNSVDYWWELRSGIPAPESLRYVFGYTTAKINGADAEVLYAGLAPGLIGVGQVNVRLPADTASGDATVTVLNGGRPSNTVKLPVR